VTKNNKTNLRTDSRGERSPMPRVPQPAMPNRMAAAASVQPPTLPAREMLRPPQLSPADPGFYIVPESMPIGRLYRDLFDDLPPGAMPKFSALNPALPSIIKAGSMIVLSDPTNTSCTFAEAQMMQAAERVKIALGPLTPDEANFMVRHRAEIGSFIGEGSTWLGVSAAIMEKHLVSVRDTLKSIEVLHQQAYGQHGNLKSAEFLLRRRQLLAQLDAHLLSSTRLRGYTTFGDNLKLKAALGISSQSLVHQWSKAGAPRQIPGYATHINSISRAAKYMNAGGYIGIGIGGISSLIAIQDVCSADPRGNTCRKVKVTEGGKFLGSTAGGLGGAEAGIKAAAPLCLALGVSTGIGGVVCVASVVGVGAWVGTTIGAIIGENLGDVVYEKALRE